MSTHEEDADWKYDEYVEEFMSEILEEYDDGCGALVAMDRFADDWMEHGERWYAEWRQDPLVEVALEAVALLAKKKKKPKKKAPEARTARRRAAAAG